jgi:MYXO-CTERM domain-containing protein
VPAAGLSTVSAHRRSLMTATASGAVLCALWFVPTAKAVPDGTGTDVRHAGHSAVTHGAARDGGPHPGAGDLESTAGRPAGVNSSDPGAIGSPYVLGGLALAGAGGALVIRSRRRAAGLRAASQASAPVTD